MLDIAGWDIMLKTRLLDIKSQAASKETKMTPEETAETCKKIVREGKDLKTASANRGLMGLYSSFDGLVLERFVGTAKFKKLLSSESREVYTEH